MGTCTASKTLESSLEWSLPSAKGAHGAMLAFHVSNLARSAGVRSSKVGIFAGGVVVELLEAGVVELVEAGVVVEFAELLDAGVAVEPVDDEEDVDVDEDMLTIP